MINFFLSSLSLTVGPEKAIAIDVHWLRRS